MGVDKAAFASRIDDAKDDDVAPRGDGSDNSAAYNANDNTKRGTKLMAAMKAEEYGTRRVCAATIPHDSDDNSDDSADKAAKPIVTNKADEATRDCARHVRVAVACESVMATGPQRCYGDMMAR